MLSRRNFLTTVGLAGGAAGLAATKLPALTPTTAPPGEVLAGERYAGFVLLPDNAAPPFDLRAPRRHPPVLCGTGVGRGGPEPNGRSVPMGDPEAAARRAGIPLYTPAPRSDLSLSGARVIEHDDGEVYAVSLSWESPDVASGEVATNITLTAYPDFVRPLPLWEENAVEPGGPYVELEKVGFLPAPGIMSRSSDGYIFHWIEGEVYYHMIVENHAPQRQARELMRSLSRVTP